MIIDASADPGLPTLAMAAKAADAAADKPPAYSPVGDEYVSGSMPNASRQQQRSRLAPPTHPGVFDHVGRHRERQPSPRSTDQRQPNPRPMDQHRSMPLPSPSVDQVHINERKHNIEGTFHVDPEIPMLDLNKRQKSGKIPHPHASFRTHNNTIDMHLGTTGNARKNAKANVLVASRDGLVKVTLLPLSPSRPRIGLNMFSRQGNIILFLPTNFIGVISLSTRKGAVNVLPALTRHMKIVRSTDRDMIIMLGNANEDIDGVREVSYCELMSRSGDVIVGFDGQDRYVPPVGFWKKLTGALSGSGHSSASS